MTTLPGQRRRAAPALAVRILVPLVTAVAALVELALADRKFGIFSGGFGQSRALDNAADLALFALGYGAAQGTLALAGWWLATRLARHRPAWAAVFWFALINGVLFCAVLAAQYQLHAYFSDAVGFALLKQLGGGSLLDAALFGLSEIGMAVLAVLAGGGAAWLAWRAARRWLPDGPPAARLRARWPLAAFALLAILGWIIPRTPSDAPFALARMLGWGALVGALDTVSDIDRDGYGLFAVQHDIAPLDAARHPLALDIPRNGIDEDGFGGDLALVDLPAPLPATRITDTRPHLVVVVMETLRGDVIGKRIGGRVVAPNLEALAREGAMVRPAYSHVGFTTESLKSLFSGRLAPRAGDPSLFTDLKDSGYRIGVFSGQPEDFGAISQTVAMRRSAEVFVDAESLKDKRAFSFGAQGSLLVDETYLLQAFDRRMGQAAWTRPHFLYFNFQSAHFPYWHEGVAPRLRARPLDRGQISAARAGDVAETYWNAVAHADAALGELVTRLKRLGVWDNTLLLVTGDHGEDLFEDGFLGHGHIINPRQYATVVVANRKGVLPASPVGLSDYRAFVLQGLGAAVSDRKRVSPFLHIGSLDAPTAIGLGEAGGKITSLRLDTGVACFSEADRCLPYDRLKGAERARVDAVVARWGSERWAITQRARNPAPSGRRNVSLP